MKYLVTLTDEAFPEYKTKFLVETEDDLPTNLPRLAGVHATAEPLREVKNEKLIDAFHNFFDNVSKEISLL